MSYDFSNEVKLFMVFDILGDMERSGSVQWRVKRERLEDIKDHILDLILMSRILRKHFSIEIDYDKMTDYIICHDLPEAITGDITKFEGVSDEEITRVTNLAIEYLSSKFENIMDFKTIINGYEDRVDIESKITKMLDKVSSAFAFIKYQSEKNIDVDDPEIMPVLRNHPFVVEKIAEGKDVADIFYEFHMKAINITDEECDKYGIKRDVADEIEDTIRGFTKELYKQKLDGTLLKVSEDFPKDAMEYNSNIEDNNK